MLSDPENFDGLIGLDADVVRAAFACPGVLDRFTDHGQRADLLGEMIEAADCHHYAILEQLARPVAFC